MRPALAFMALVSTAALAAADLPTSVEITIEPQKFGDVGSILKVDSTVANFRFDRPVSHLALVLEAFPKEPRMVPVARLALNLTKPVAEGRFCVQMVDQGFLPVGNGAPHQMQLFMQLDCGDAIISSSQSFLKEKFTFSKSLARAGAGTFTRKITGARAPVFWLMGNSDSGTYFHDDDLETMIAKNRDAYVLVAHLEIAKEPGTSVLGGSPGEGTKSVAASKAAALSASAISPSVAVASSTRGGAKPTAAKSSGSATSKKKKKRSS